MNRRAFLGAVAGVAVTPVATSQVLETEEFLAAVDVQQDKFLVRIQAQSAPDSRGTVVAISFDSYYAKNCIPLKPGDVFHASFDGIGEGDFKVNLVHWLSPR